MMRGIIVFFIGVLLCSSIVTGKEYRNAPAACYTPQLRLYFYACEGSVEGVEQALADGAEIDKLSDAAYNALHYAIHMDRVDVVQFLLKRKADPNALTGRAAGLEWKASPLIMATIMNHHEIGRMLLFAGADPYFQRHAMNAASFALQDNRNDFIELFLDAGVDISRVMRFNGGIRRSVPALTYAARHGSLDQVRRLVDDFDVSVNPKVETAYDSPLFTAILHGNVEVVKYLIQHGVDIHRELPLYKSGSKVGAYYALEVAARSGRVEITRILLEKGGQPVRNLSKDRDPVFLADALGYDYLLELYESYGYRSNYWEQLDVDSRLQKVLGHRVDSVLAQSLFSAKHLEGDWGALEDADPAVATRVRVAVVGDDSSQDLTSLLAVELSSRDSMEVLDREQIDGVLNEHRLGRSGILNGNDWDEFSKMLGADFMLLVRKFEVPGEEQGFELRLINAPRGILLDTRICFVEESQLERFCAGYVIRITSQLAKFGKNLQDLKWLSVVNVRADFGSIAGLQLERQAHRLLEYELSKRSDVLLMERHDIDSMARENQLSGEVENTFEAASGFVDGRIELNAARDDVSALHLRMKPNQGEVRSVSVSLVGRAFEEGLREAVSGLFSLDSSIGSPASADLHEDFKRLIQEARWFRKVGLHQSALRYVRNAIALKDGDGEDWLLYLQCLSSAYPALSQHDKFSDPIDFDRVFLHEQERLYVLDTLYRMHIEERKGSEHTFLQGHAGFEYSIALLDAVSLRRRYGERIRLLEEEYLKLVRRRVIPLFSLYKQERHKLVYEDYDCHVGAVLRVVRHIRGLDEGRIEEAVCEVLRAYSKQYADLSFWPSSSRRLYNYDAYSHKQRPMGWMRDEQILKWVVEYASPYLAYEFITELIREDWMFERRASRGNVARWVDTLLDLRQQMTTRDEVFMNVFLSDRSHLHQGWLDSRHVMPKERKVSLGKGLFWMTRDNVAICGLKRVLYPKSRSQEMSGVELDRAQLKYTQSLFEACVQQFPWADERAPLVRTYLQEQLIHSSADLQESTPVHTNGDLPVAIWHPEAYGYMGFRLMHAPELYDGKWFVLATDGRTSQHKTRDYMLFTIDAVTYATSGRRFNSSDFPRISGSSSAVVSDDWLIYESDEYGPITCLNLDDLSTHVIEGYRSHFSGSPLPPSGCLIRGKFYAVVVTLEDLDNVKQSELSRLLVEYDPDRRISKVLANSRRHSSGSKLDEIISEISELDYEEASDALILADGGKRIYAMLIDTLEVRLTEVSFPWAHYHTDQVLKQYQEMGLITLSGFPWHIRATSRGKWERLLSQNALLFSNWENFPYQWKAIEFVPRYTGEGCEVYKAMTAKMKSDEWVLGPSDGLSLSFVSFWYGESYGRFFIGDRVVAFFKTKNLAAALKESDVLPQR